MTTTTWNITNKSTLDWTLASSDLDHGIWSSNPPKYIKSGKGGNFGAESDGLATGDAGTVKYQSDDGQFVFYFDNPYIGAVGYKVTCPDGYDHQTNQTTDQALTTRCFKADGTRKI